MNTTNEVVTTPTECVNFVNRVGLCTWRTLERVPGFPSLEAVTPWSGADVTYQTWFWKDDLHTEKRLFYGQLIGAEIPVFVSLAFLPTLIAAQGDNDARTLYEKGRLSAAALRVYEHIERNGASPMRSLPWPSGSRQTHLAALQRRFLIAKTALTGRTRGTYGYVWGLCETHVPEAFAAAAKITVAEARARVREHLAAQGVSLSEKETKRLFHWDANE